MTWQSHCRLSKSRTGTIRGLIQPYTTDIEVRDIYLLHEASIPEKKRLYCIIACGSGHGAGETDMDVQEAILGVKRMIRRERELLLLVCSITVLYWR